MSKILYDLKTGYPDLSLIPREQLSEITAKLLFRDRPLQYVGDMRGDTETREAVAAYLTHTTSASVDADEVMITAGAISSTDQVCRMVTEPGDIVLVENPTFYFIIHKLELSHVTVMGVPMADDGVDVDALEALCREHGERISLFYAIPSFQNPTGINATDANRRRVIDLAHQYDFTIVEDSTYQTLYFDAPPPPMLREYDPSGRVITVGSFSKQVMPSLRIGWIWATAQQIEDLLPWKATATSTYMSQLMMEFINSGAFYEQLDRARTLYGSKHDVMIEALQQHAPADLQYHTPQGGFFIWATLPEHMKASDVLQRAHDHGVDFSEGALSFVRGEAADRYMRLCFAMQPDAIMRKGVEVLCECLKTMPVN